MVFLLLRLLSPRPVCVVGKRTCHKKTVHGPAVVVIGLHLSWLCSRQLWHSTANKSFEETYSSSPATGANRKWT